MKQYNNRAHTGRYISRHEIARRKSVRNELRTLVAIITIPFIFGIIAYYIDQTGVRIDTTRNFVPTAEASFIPMTDICELQDVICEDEQPVARSVDAISEAIGHRVTDETVRRVTYLYEKTTEAGVPFYDAVKTIYCESQWMAQKSWLPEESYGIAQIHLPSHRVTREQAMDAYFAIDFLVERWWDTKWYGYDRDTKQCANKLNINI